MLALAEHAHDDGGSSFPTIETLQERTLLSRAQVQRNLRALVKDGEIVQSGATKQGVNVYRILMEGGPHIEAPGASFTTSALHEMRPDPSEDLQPSKTLWQESVIECWQSRDPLPTHRVIDKPTRKLIDQAIQTHGVQEVIDAIKSYATVLASPEHYWSHRWTLGEFLKRGLARFLPEMNPLENFRGKLDGSLPTPTEAEGIQAWQQVELRWGGDKSVELSARTRSTLATAGVTISGWRMRNTFTARQMRDAFLDAWARWS